MTAELVQEKLNSLLDLLRQERRAAIALNMQEFERLTTCKQQLMDGFDPQPNEVKGVEDLLRQIDQENRRNAYLIWAGLGWVRQTMQFFGQSSVAQTYGDAGESLHSRQEVHLLTGKV
jgi:flagellar biosynthesis/type III secretory pathway chaperone